MKQDLKFDILFEDYLKYSNSQDVKAYNAEEIKLIKQAFYGGCMMLLKNLLNYLDKSPDDQALLFFIDLENQLILYFMNETNGMFIENYTQHLP